MTEAHPDKGYWILQADLLHNFVCSKKLIQCHIKTKYYLSLCTCVVKYSCIIAFTYQNYLA